MDRVTVAPFLLAMFLAVFRMDTLVVQVNRAEMGHEYVQPWHRRALSSVSRPARDLMARLCALFRGHAPAGAWLGGVAALAAMVLWASSGPEGVQWAVGVAAVGVTGWGLKEAREAVYALDRQLAENQARGNDIDREIAALCDVVQKENRAMTEDEAARLADLRKKKASINDVRAALLEQKADATRRLAEIEEATDAERRGHRVGDPDRETAARMALEAGLSVQVGADRAALDPTAGFRSMADFARAVRSAFTPGGQVDARLTRGIYAADPANVHQSGGGAGEGYAVPAQFREEIFTLAFPGSDLISRLSPEPTDSNAVDIEADETTPWGASGVQAKWRAEGTQMAASKSKTELRTVRLHELYAFVLATEELLDDAPRLQNRLTVKSAEAIRYKASDAVINGTGAGMPLGWMKSGALVTVSKESGQAAATLNATNVLKMYSRAILDGGSAFWVAHTSILPQLATMTIGNQPIWTPPNQGLAGSPGGLLLGLPLVYAEQAEQLGTAGDLQLVNPAGYFLAVKRNQGIQFASSIHLYFDYGLNAFRWLFRLGGQPFLSAPITRAKGTDTKSHFVCLQTRS